MICTSINEQIVHGIPGPRVLQTGDIVSVDVGVIYKGYHGDAAITLGVGEIDAESQELLAITAEALRIGIEAARPGDWTWTFPGRSRPTWRAGAIPWCASIRGTASANGCTKTRRSRTTMNRGSAGGFGCAPA